MKKTPVLSVEEMKARLSSLNPDELKALQDVYHLSMLKIWSRGTGWLNLFLGGVTLWLGLCNLHEITGLIQAVAGFLVIGQSLWAIVLPDTAGMLRFAFVFLGAGIWNLLIALVGPASGSVFIAILAMMQLGFAITTYRDYQRYRQMALIKLKSDVIQFYDSARKMVSRGALKRDADAFEMWIGLNKWRGLILSERVVFAALGHNLLIIQAKDEANFVPNSSRPERKRQVYGRIMLDAVYERAVMSRSAYIKYAKWRGEDIILAEVTPTLWQRLPRVVRAILLIIGGLFLGYIVLIIIEVMKLLIQYS